MLTNSKVSEYGAVFLRRTHVEVLKDIAPCSSRRDAQETFRLCLEGQHSRWVPAFHYALNKCPAPIYRRERRFF